MLMLQLINAFLFANICMRLFDYLINLKGSLCQFFVHENQFNFQKEYYYQVELCHVWQNNLDGVIIALLAWTMPSTCILSNGQQGATQLVS